MPERVWLPKVKRARLVYQLGERSVRIREVESSNLFRSTICIAGRTPDYEIIISWHGFWLALDLTAQV